MTVKVIHIFAYGEAQIISDEYNFKSAVGNFKKLQAVIDDVKSKRPNDVEEKDFYAIHIFFAPRVMYLSGEKKGSFNCKFADLNRAKIDELVSEFQSLRESELKQ